MQTVARHVGERERLTRVAWERFVSGNDDIKDVPALILLSWQRSRDVYRIDPMNTGPPRATGIGSTSLLQDSVIAQLGGIAAGFAQRLEDSLTTVTDGTGRVLASWGADTIRRRAADINLAPMFAWSESAAGTNGMGTALGRTHPVSVRGPEHWCARLHDWTCTAISISDAVTALPIAVLNVSLWKQEPGRALPRQLERAVTPIRSRLRAEAVRDGVELVKAFTVADRSATVNQAVMVADAAGNVVAANARALAVGGHLPTTPAAEPSARRYFVSSRLREVVAEARVQARSNPHWSHVFRLAILQDELAFTVRPIHIQGEFMGIVLVSSDDQDGELVLDSAQGPQVAPNCLFRLAGICENRLIVLAPHEVRYAEADKHAVWLVTDRGRVRAADRGLANIESQLRRFGFLRVHRSYLVNVDRIREVDQGICRGTLTVSTRHHGCEAIPVARRHVSQLRTALGM